MVQLMRARPRRARPAGSPQGKAAANNNESDYTALGYCLDARKSLGITRLILDIEEAGNRLNLRRS